MPKVDITMHEVVFDDFFKIEAATVSFQRFDGRMSQPLRRLSFVRGDSVAAILYNEQRDAVVLVNQFKYPTYQHSSGWITELVAGMIGDDEDPMIAIRREILEETGYRVDNLEHLSTFYLSPGGSSERIWLYFAIVEDSSKIDAGGGVQKEGEDIKILELSLSDAWKSVQKGQIVDGKTILGILWLAKLKNKFL